MFELLIGIQEGATHLQSVNPGSSAPFEGEQTTITTNTKLNHRQVNLCYF